MLQCKFQSIVMKVSCFHLLVMILAICSAAETSPCPWSHLHE